MTTPTPTRRPRRTASKRKTAAQLHAGRYLDLSGIVHFLFTEKRCPVIYEGKLAYVKCPGVSEEAFKKAIHERVVRNICHMIRDVRTAGRAGGGTGKGTR